jgi:hypothetical protein
MSAQACYQSLIVRPTRNARLKQALREGKPAPQPEAEEPLPDVNARQFSQQLRLDAAMWYGAIETGPNRIPITKLFHLFYYAGVLYLRDGGWADWRDNNLANVASLLSHGQRVMVQLPRGDKGRGVWTWLNQPNAIPSRDFATHGISPIQPAAAMGRGRFRYFDEKHSPWQSLKGHVQGYHYAFNPALGGARNRNPFSATNDDETGAFTPIAGDGRNGHVYVYYRPPTNDAPGGMLVGCENVAHSMGSNPHTGAGHSETGARQKVSACGGKKWSELGTGPSTEYGSMVCDLVGLAEINIDWLLSTELFNPACLDEKPVRVAQV